MAIINNLKRKFYNKYYKRRIESIAASCGKGLYVGGKSFVNTKTYLGNKVSFNGMSIYGRGKVIIGDYFHSGTECQMITSFHNYDSGNAIPYDETFVDKDINIESCVWLGNNVIILGGVTIGEGAIIQAGSIVCNDIPKMAIAGGHPAKVFKYRDIEHYNILKKERSFH